jgi:hypothetical protein
MSAARPRQSANFDRGGNCRPAEPARTSGLSERDCSHLIPPLRRTSCDRLYISKLTNDGDENPDRLHRLSQTRESVLFRFQIVIAHPSRKDCGFLATAEGPLGPHTPTSRLFTRADYTLGANVLAFVTFPSIPVWVRACFTLQSAILMSRDHRAPTRSGSRRMTSMPSRRSSARCRARIVPKILRGCAGTPPLKFSPTSRRNSPPMRAREWSTASPTQAAARRPRRGLARGRHRLRHRRDAFCAQRRDAGSRQRPRAARRAGRSHRSMDLHARARRPLAGVGDPAVVTPKTLNVMAGRSPGHFVCWRLAIARKFTPPACRIRPPWAAG